MDRTLSGETKVCGIFGNPIRHSASPRMHGAAYRALGLNWVYVPFLVEPDSLATAVKAIRSLGIMGVNVTIPHKEQVIPLLDELDDSAHRSGSVNTIVRRGNRLIGYSTDGDGLLLSLKRELNRDVLGQSIFLIGAGGAARSIAFSVVAAGASSLWVSNRTRFRADALCHDIRQVFPNCQVHAMDEGSPKMDDALRHADIVINTTPIGMAPNVDAIPYSSIAWVTDKHLVCDIIYKPHPTRWLKEVAERGAQTVGGAGMLAGQGILAFHLFTGFEVPYDIMRNEV